MVETLQLVQCELIKHPASFNNMMKNITPALHQWLQSNLALPMVDFIIVMVSYMYIACVHTFILVFVFLVTLTIS